MENKFDKEMENVLHDIKYITGAFNKISDNVAQAEKDLRKVDNAVTNNRKDLLCIKNALELLSEQIENLNSDLTSMREKYVKTIVRHLKIGGCVDIINGHSLKELVKKYLNIKTNESKPVRIKLKEDEIVIIRIYDD